jgi:hypothetical protein
MKKICEIWYDDSDGCNKMIVLALPEVKGPEFNVVAANKKVDPEKAVALILSEVRKLIE